MLADDYLAELAADLHRFRAGAMLMRPYRRRVKGFDPHPHECHSNAEAWVALHPQHRVVRGWVVFDYQLSAIPMVRFQAHSVVEDADGRLIDVTPREGSRPLPFLLHPDGNEMFELVVSRREIVSISHRLK